MQTFTRIEAAAAPFPFAHVDTDRIIPARYMTTISRHGLGRHLFAGDRYDVRGNERSDFVLNQPPWRRAGILVAYENFGCGSSREHAVWALADFGFRCVVAPSFGDIFRINCLKNGLLPITVPRLECERLIGAVAGAAGALFTVDLERQAIRLPSGEELLFSIHPRERLALLTGADDVTRTLCHEQQIAAYEAGLDRSR